MSKVKIFCATVSDVEMKGTDILVYFHDGEIRAYADGQKFYDHIIQINGLQSVGSFYRSQMRDAGAPYTVVQGPTNDMNINK